MDVCDWVGIHFCQKNVVFKNGGRKDKNKKNFVRTLFMFSLPLPYKLQATGSEGRERAPAGVGGGEISTGTMLATLAEI
jgi:hypothetical protein